MNIGGVERLDQFQGRAGLTNGYSARSCEEAGGASFYTVHEQECVEALWCSIFPLSTVKLGFASCHSDSLSFNILCCYLKGHTALGMIAHF